MSDTAFRIAVDDAHLREVFQRAPAQVQKTIGQLVQGAAIDIQREMRIAANVGVTGDLRRSIRYTYSPAQLRAVVQPNVPYAEDVESGTKPHQVSAQPGSSLARWAKLKGLNPYAVRASIARKGTKAHPYVQPTFDKMKPKVESDIVAGISSLIAGLAK